MYRRAILRRNRAPDDSGEYAKPKVQYAIYTTTPGRLRRSLRGVAAPPPLTKSDRFEKIITSVAGSTYPEERTIQRQFSMPGYILAEAQSILQSKVDASVFEELPTTILLEIVNNLEGNHQIMLALTCKRLASIVEASEIRKIANITDYVNTISRWWMLQRVGDGSTDDMFIARGYGRPPPQPPAPNPLPTYWWPESYTEYHAAKAQVAELKKLVIMYLGKDYDWCEGCQMFRLLDKKWWLEFADYENPGVVKKSKDTKKKVTDAITNWCNKKPDSSEACPAHVLLQERKGRRVVEELPPPKISKKKGKGSKKGRGRKRKLQEMETDSEIDDSY